MSGTAAAPGPAWVAAIGDRIAHFEPQDAIARAIEHAAASLEIDTPALRWIATPDLAEAGTGLLRGAAAVWCAPGGPYRDLEGALTGIRWARETEVPFLGTCAGFQHGVLEFARHVLGITTASHAEYREPVDGGALFIDELACSLLGQTMRVELVDPVLRSYYGRGAALERYYCRFGLQSRWRGPLQRAGLVVAGVDAHDGDVRIMRLVGHRFYVLTLFVPQTSSAPDAPHPLVVALLRAVLSAPTGPGVSAPACGAVEG